MSNPNPERDERVSDELTQLRKEMELNSLGDRPHSMSAKKLARLIELEGQVDADPRTQRLMAQLQGVMNCLAASQQEVERHRLAATAMRDRCVAKVSAQIEKWKQEIHGTIQQSTFARTLSAKIEGAQEIKVKLESLTLDQVEQK